MCYSGPWTYEYVTDWLSENKLAMHWELFHSVLGLSIGLVPFICAVIWSIGKRTNILILLAYFVFCWGTTYLIILSIFNYLVPVMPESSVWQLNHTIILPFELFWNYALIFASCVAPSILLVMDLVHRRALSSRAIEQEKSLDHSI